MTDEELIQRAREAFQRFNEPTQMQVDAIASQSLRGRLVEAADALFRAADERDELRELLAEVATMAMSGHTPDGDTVNTPTLLWAETWAKTAAQARGEAEILAAYARRRLKRAARELAKEAQTK